MENKVCSGFGHRNILKSITNLYDILEYLILNENVTVFMTGGMGGFDGLFISAVKSL